jgi:uncharacterized protein YodC (DUF2158 family)
MSDFKPGDVVRLKSGGPKMTVDQVGDDQFQHRMVWCDWIEGNKKFTETFPPTSLELSK